LSLLVQIRLSRGFNAPRRAAQAAGADGRPTGRRHDSASDRDHVGPLKGRDLKQPAGSDSYCTAPGTPPRHQKRHGLTFHEYRPHPSTFSAVHQLSPSRLHRGKRPPQSSSPYWGEVSSWCPPNGPSTSSGGGFRALRSSQPLNQPKGSSRWTRKGPEARVHASLGTADPFCWSVSGPVRRVRSVAVHKARQSLFAVAVISRILHPHILYPCILYPRRGRWPGRRVGRLRRGKRYRRARVASRTIPSLMRD
jgi:hypothetical protein